MLSEESSYKLLKQLEANPAISQRELAREMGMSLGKVNYCLRALIEKRSVKSSSVRTSEGKVTSLYELTNEGSEYLLELTSKLLQLRTRQLEEINREIDEIRSILNFGSIPIHGKKPD